MSDFTPQFSDLWCERLQEEMRRAAERILKRPVSMCVSLNDDGDALVHFTDQETGIRAGYYEAPYASDCEGLAYLMVETAQHAAQRLKTSLAGVTMDT